MSFDPAESSLVASTDAQHQLQLDSDESSVTSSVTFDRINRRLVLPSISSHATLQHLTKKLADIPRVRHNGKAIAARSHDKTADNAGLDKSFAQLSLYESTTGTNDSHVVPDSIGSPAMDKAQQFNPKTLNMLDRFESIRQNDEAPSNPQVEQDTDSEEWLTGQPSNSVPDLDYDDVRLINEQWARVREQRFALNNTFTKIERGRDALQNIRQQKNQAYQKLKLAIQKLLPTYASLGELFKTAEDLDLACQKVEIDMDELVDELEDGELELQVKERRFYTRFAESETTTETDSSHPASRATLLGIGGDRPEEFHPVFEDLRHAFREVQLADENRENLTNKRDALALKTREERSNDEEKFMADYEIMFKEANEEVTHWSGMVEQLEKECLERDLLPKDWLTEQYGLDVYHVPSEEIYLEEKLMTRSSAGTAPKTLAHPQFEFLLSNPKHLLKDPFPQTAARSLRAAVSLPRSLPRRDKFIEEAKKEYGIESLLASMDNEDKQGYINRWLLHKLRHSALEAELLLVCFTPNLQIKDLEHWQRDVLFFWSRDVNAIELTSQDKNLPDGKTSDATDVSRRTSPRISLQSRRASMNSQLPSRSSRGASIRSDLSGNRKTAVSKPSLCHSRSDSGIGAGTIDANFESR
ncbi:hypothetical protein SCUP234_07287 [Seiridium cupressi]